MLSLDRLPEGGMTTNEIISIDPETGFQTLDGLLGYPAELMARPENLRPVQEVTF